MKRLQYGVWVNVPGTMFFGCIPETSNLETRNQNQKPETVRSQGIDQDQDSMLSQPKGHARMTHARQEGQHVESI